MVIDNFFNYVEVLDYRTKAKKVKKKGSVYHHIHECSNADNCDIYKEKACVLLSGLKCPYGTTTTLKSPCISTKGFKLWFERQVSYIGNENTRYMNFSHVFTPKMTSTLFTVGEYLFFGCFYSITDSDFVAEVYSIPNRLLDAFKENDYFLFKEQLSLYDLGVFLQSFGNYIYYSEAFKKILVDKF